MAIRLFSMILVCFLMLGCGLVPLRTSGAAGHAVHISVDGLRGDFIEQRVADQPELYPNFKRFVDEGATTFNARTDYTHTITLPNHTSMVTGRPVSRPSGAPNTTHHGYTDNGEPSASETLHNSGNPNVSYIASTFDVAHDHGLSTALYAGKSKFALYNQSYNGANGAPDEEGQDFGRDKIDSFVAHPSAHEMFLTNLSLHHFQYSFLHYMHADGAGHSSGWGGAEWNGMVQFIDNSLGTLMSLIETDAELKNDTVIVLTADHGGTGTGHSTASTQANYTIPVLVWGAGVAAGVDLYSLNADTRTNPGTTRPSYTDDDQPIRNGDTGNLALALLGLGPVPGSTINVAQDLRVASLLSADFNGDLSVDDDDLAAWQTGYGNSALAHSVKGDADGDRDVDGRDFLAWQRQFGSSAAPPESNTVPEATLGGMLSVLGCYVTLRRARSKRLRSSSLL